MVKHYTSTASLKEMRDSGVLDAVGLAEVNADIAAREKEERNAWALAEVLATHEGRISTHYEGCWKYHAGCLAALLTGDA